jgi:hypothetical protein
MLTEARFDQPIEPMTLGTCQSSAWVTRRIAWRGDTVAPMEIPKLTNEQRRALRALARHADGCSRPALLADGFSVCQFVILVIEGLPGCDESPSMSVVAKRR